MRWFDANPSGRTMSRFTSDLQLIESLLWQELDATLQLGGFAIVSVLLACTLQGGMLVVPAILLFGFLGMVTDATGRSVREVKRLANNAVSPILSSVAEIRSGAAAIRAMALQPFFVTRQRGLVEEWAGLAFHQKALNSWGLVNASYAECTRSSSSDGVAVVATPTPRAPSVVVAVMV